MDVILFHRNYLSEERGIKRGKNLFQECKLHSRSKTKSFDQALILEEKDCVVIFAFKIGPYNFQKSNKSEIILGLLNVVLGASTMAPPRAEQVLPSLTWS